jgi:hypothetical protein
MVDKNAGDTFYFGPGVHNPGIIRLTEQKNRLLKTPLTLYQKLSSHFLLHIKGDFKKYIYNIIGGELKTN